MRQATAVRARWSKPPPPPPPVILTGRHARRYGRTLAAQADPGPSPLFRHRHKLVPVAWGLPVALAASALWVVRVPVVPVVITGLILGGVMVGATRHLSRFTRRWWEAAAACTALFLPLVAARGPRPWLLAFAVCWAILAGVWGRHYRIRGDEEPSPSSDEQTWARLAEHKRWEGTLGKAEPIPNGVRYPLQLDGVVTHIGNVMSEPMAVAGAWHKPITEAYIEPSRDGIASRGTLTILKQGTLQAVRKWDGAGVTPEGLAVIGRFADAADARIRLFAPMDGTRHGIIAGATGAGKTQLLELLALIDLASGIVPIVLDPQNGQSLPHLRGRVPYAAGVDECMEMLRLVAAAMMERSRVLADMVWEDEGHKVRGMPFFDSGLTGWPVIHVIGDEFPLLLTHGVHGNEAVYLAGQIAKLGRKTGVSLWPVAQVPSLAELGDQVVRSMLVGGNVVCLRTGDRVSAGMLGLPADPSELPRYFAGGEPSYGLCYVIGPDNRQAVARTDLPPSSARHATRGVAELDPVFADALARFGKLSGVSQVLTAAGINADNLADAIEWAASNAAPNGKTAADAVLAVLDRPMERGEIVNRVRAKSLEWGRAQAFSLKAISDALRKLRADGQITQDGERAPYAPAQGRGAA